MYISVPELIFFAVLGILFYIGMFVYANQLQREGYRRYDELRERYDKLLKEYNKLQDEKSKQEF